MVETDIQTKKPIMKVLRDLQLPKDYYVEVKPDKHKDEWHEDIIARKIDATTGKTLDIIKVRRFAKSSILASPTNVNPY